ncbi:Transcription factor TFIIIC, triple barrel domain [Dillenia turbinata]|uniref:Transcription factor TFIIIC, triple barrel domain n=1 Tax=Dillenia turbinata TaxID=194707 RepID=A0AAN8VIK3_9MAGN
MEKSVLSPIEMEANTSQQEQEQDEEEFVLLDLEGACGKVDIPPNAPYVLSGLDTLNPVLLIGDKLKLIGEYEETIGTCFVFSEEETTPIVNEETGQSEENPSTSKGVGDSNQAPTKKIKPIARLQKTLKFRLVSEVDSVGTTADAQTADEPNQVHLGNDEKLDSDGTGRKNNDN